MVEKDIKLKQNSIYLCISIKTKNFTPTNAIKRIEEEKNKNKTEFEFKVSSDTGMSINSSTSNQ